MNVKPIPEGHAGVMPYLIVHDVPRLIEFLTRVFDATEIARHDTPSGDVMHAEVRVRDSVIMMGGASGQWPPMPAAMHIYMEDVDAAYRRALDAGATSLSEPADQFYGDRSASVKDPSGNTWFIATHVEDVPEEEMARRSQAALEARAKG